MAYGCAAQRGASSLAVEDSIERGVSPPLISIEELLAVQAVLDRCRHIWPRDEPLNQPWRIESENLYSCSPHVYTCVLECTHGRTISLVLRAVFRGMVVII